MNSKASTDEVKVTQLAGATSEKSDYHHGETSCEAAIVHLAQRYCPVHHRDRQGLSGPTTSTFLNRMGSLEHVSETTWVLPVTS